MRVNDVYEGDCLDVMRQFPDNCIDTILTDPPYSLSSIKRRFSKTSIDDDNLTGQAAKNGTHQYGRLSAGFMGKEWDNEIAFSPEVWREALRVAKPGAALLAFGGTRTYHRLVCAIEDAGWEIRDCTNYFNDGTQAERAFMASLNEEQLAAYLELHYPGRQMSWIYGQGFPKSKDISKAIDDAKGAKREVVGESTVAGMFKQEEQIKQGYRLDNGSNGYAGERNGAFITAPATPLAKQFDGWGTSLKPSYEPIVIAQKPIDQNYAHNAERWGVSGIWVDGARIEAEDKDDYGRSPNKANGRRSRTRGHSFGEGLKEDVGVSHPKGRWPANVIHDGSDEVEAEFAKAGVRTSGKSGKNGHIRKKSLNYKSNVNYADRSEQAGDLIGDQGSASRFFAQCPPDPTQHPEAARFRYCPKASTAERGSANNHPTVKPLSLMRYLCRLTKTPTGGIVLDPFAGSGTTALACISEGRDYILIDKEPEYAEICRRRIAEYTGQEIAPKEIELADNQKVKQMSLW